MTTRPIAALLVICLSFAVRSSADETKDKEKPRDARETVKAFVELAMDGKYEEAAKLGDPGQTPSQPKVVKDNFSKLKIENFAVKSVHADDANALAMSSKVKDDRGREGLLVFELVKKQDRWLIHDIDFENDKSAKDELKRFLDKHPDAKVMPETEKAKNGENSDGN
jgi:hypothetical protein